MKISVNQELRYSRQKLTEIFFISNRDEKIIDTNRQIFDILEYIAYRFSIIEIVNNYVETKTNCFSIQNSIEIEEFELPFIKRVISFDYLPIVKKFKCTNCKNHTKDKICIVRGIKTDGIWRNCLYYIEKLKIKNLKVTEYK